jgi:serine/threonine protein kinase
LTFRVHFRPAARWRRGAWFMSGRVGPFRLLRDMSAGVPGAAWLAQGEDGAQVMLKRARQQAPTNEFRLLAELDHPGVPRLAACGLDGGEFWVATHWFDGTTLEGGFAAGADEEAFAAAASHALLYLSSCGVVHGDVHPGNILAAQAGYPARLLDFGLASDGPNLPAGRRGFIAPEVLAGAERTTASDLFGLGASLRARGAARSGHVGRLAESLVSPDPGVRLAAGWGSRACWSALPWKRAPAGGPSSGKLEARPTSWRCGGAVG